MIILTETFFSKIHIILHYIILNHIVLYYIGRHSGAVFRTVASQPEGPKHAKLGVSRLITNSNSPIGVNGYYIILYFSNLIPAQFNLAIGD